ncbi:WD40 repeat domain-containing protein [Pedobacter sp. SYP-B3415]|uniref:WD40 repeat domain-containing protein n=1 Tax=Pedobacter sp. SYP-B3415 TaxID=2496641 RepID=UPI00101CFFE8|nr:WD40 repeat domain-containing protein [Pedobacter sp. SYP-B3415]
MLHLKKTLPGHQNPVYALAADSSRPFFYTAGNDKGVVEWAADSLSFSKVLMPVASSVYALHVYENKLFAGQKSGLIEAFDFSTGGTTQMPAHNKAVFALQGIPQKNELVSCGEDGILTVWSADSLQHLYQLQVSPATARCLALSPGGQELAVGSKDNLIRIYDTTDYSLRAEIAGHQGPVTSLRYAPDGTWLLSGSRDAQVKKWSAGNYEELTNLPAHLFAVYGIVFHPSLPYFATCSQDKSIKLWSADDFRLLKILSIDKAGSGHTHSVNTISWTPDGDSLLSTGDDKLVQVWTWN